MSYEKLLQDRMERAKQIIRDSKITFTGDKWIVPSQTKREAYVVKLNKRKHIMDCTCPDFTNRRIECKHLFAVELMLTKEVDRQGNVTITQTKKITYSQVWSAYDKSHQKEMFLELLNDLCKMIPQPLYKFGRPKMPISEMIFASTLKVFTTFSLRRFETDMRVAKEKGFVDKVPCFASVGHFIQSEELIPVIKELIKLSALPLKAVEEDFTVDASGFSSSRFARWFDYKYGKETERRVWVKAHLMSGTKTNIVTSAEVTTSFEHDSKFLTPLLKETVKNFKVKELSADMGYSSRDNLDSVNEIDAIPFIPFKKNTKQKAYGSSTWSKMWHYFNFKHDEFLEHYHKRSKAETVFHMIKSKFGDAVRSKTEIAQINEVLLKVLCHNICVVIQEINELGIEPIFVCNKSA